MSKTDKCWICQYNEADSGEHIVMKSVLDTIMGKPTPTSPRYVNRMTGIQNIPIYSFKNNRMKFKKSICQDCNNRLTQPYDDAFRSFVEKIIKSKTAIIARQKISFSSMDDKQLSNLALYFIKILGCLIVAIDWKIPENDFQALRTSLQSGKVCTDKVYLSFHRDLENLEARKGVTVSHLPVINRDFIAWTIDLDWLSLVISYPFFPGAGYGQNWKLGNRIRTLRLGKILKN